MAPREIMMLAFSGIAILMLGLGLPLISGMVSPNRFYGVRTRRTVEDPEVWFPANAYGGRWLLGFGVALLVLNFVLYLLTPIPDEICTFILVGASLAGMIVMGVRVLQRVDAIAKELDRKEPR